MEWDPTYKNAIADRVPRHETNFQRRTPRSLSGNKLQQVISLLGIGLLIASLVGVNPSPTIPVQLSQPTNLVTPGTASWLTPAPKINITGNSAWISCPWVNGSGTWSDPYTIRNLSIDAGGIGSGIIIRNTNKYFRIMNCTLSHSGSGTYDAGITINNAGNGTIFNNTVYANQYGIFLSSASNNTLVGNNCSSGGIHVSSGKDNILDSNLCSAWPSGIYLASDNCTLINNTCLGHANGIDLNGANCTLINNNCTGHSYVGISISGSNNILTGNYIKEGIWGGIELISARNTTLAKNVLQSCSVVVNGDFDKIFPVVIQSDNTVNGRPIRAYINQSECTVPIDTGQAILINCNSTTIANHRGQGLIFALCYSFNNTIRNNLCKGGTHGIYLSASENNTITGNDCTENLGNGMYLIYSANNNTIIGNNCSKNPNCGILISGCNNTVVGNNCSENTGPGICLDNTMNDTLVGNNCTGNEVDGINVSGGGNHTLVTNFCMENIFGIYITGANHTLFGNNCSRNANGIFLGFRSNNNLLVENKCNENTDSGIFVGSKSVNNTLSQNNCTQNNVYGIGISQSNSTIISGNTCSKNGRGVSVESDSFYTEVCQNWVKKSKWNAIQNSNPTTFIYDNIIINYSYASFTANVTSLIAGRWVNFTDTSTSGGLTIDYQWNFGDLPGNETSHDIIRQYSSGGTWDAILTIIDSEGDCSVAKNLIQVEPDFQPIATITPAPASIPYGQIADFYATPTGNSPVNYTWNFGDETPLGNGTHVTHLYADFGTYPVTLNVSDADGDFATITIQANVVNTLPWIEHLKPISVIEGTVNNQITWHATDLNTNQPNYTISRDGIIIQSASWILNGDIIVDLDGLTVGTYTFTLSINDGYGGISVESVIVSVAPAPPWGIIIAIAGAGLVVVVVVVRKFKSKA